MSGLAYLTSIPGRIIDAWRQGAMEVVLSCYTPNELTRVLPKLPRAQLDTNKIATLVNSFLLLAEVLEPDKTFDLLLRDSADQQILALLIFSHADCLITGDKDLLALSGRYPILTPAVFWSDHDSESSLSDPR